MTKTSTTTRSFLHTSAVLLGIAPLIPSQCGIGGQTDEIELSSAGKHACIDSAVKAANSSAGQACCGGNEL